MTWSLPELLAALHDDIQKNLETIRKTVNHSGSKGDATENVWIKLLKKYLPRRYKTNKAHVVDSKGNFSEQIDIVVFDRQYSPFIFHIQDQIVVPAESVYAVFEVKQTANAKLVEYAQDKVASVRKLHRTSLPIPYAKGKYPPKPLIPILGGILTLESDWSPAMGKPLAELLENTIDEKTLNIGCFATHGYFYQNESSNEFEYVKSDKSATAFLLRLISNLQFRGTVPMIDVDAYAKWLTDDSLAS